MTFNIIGKNINKRLTVQILYPLCHILQYLNCKNLLMCQGCCCVMGNVGTSFGRKKKAMIFLILLNGVWCCDFQGTAAQCFDLRLHFITAEHWSKVSIWGQWPVYSIQESTCFAHPIKQPLITHSRTDSAVSQKKRPGLINDCVSF